MSRRDRSPARLARLRPLVGALVVASLLALPQASAVRAGTAIVVDTLEDVVDADGDCSLREAITAADTDAVSDGCLAGSGRDAITFDVAGTISLGDELPDVTGPLSIDGTGSAIVIADAPADTSDVRGGGALTNTDALTLRGLTFSNNRSAYSGGAVNNFGELVVERSTFDHNFAFELGGAIYSTNALVVLDTTFDHNATSRQVVAGHASAGGAIDNTGGMQVSSSTFSNNDADSTGGAIATSNDATITKSTFSANGLSANHGGAIANHGDRLLMTYSTLSLNTARDGGAAVWSEPTEFGVTIISTSILANSENGGDCAGTNVIDAGKNIFEDGSCLTNDTSLTGDPGLGALSDHGGWTKTHGIFGGIAIDAIGYDTYGCAAGIVDQRGTSRPQGAGCDIGSFEFHDTQEPAAFVTTNPSAPGGLNGWFTSGVKATVSAADTGGSGVSEVRCALDPAAAPTDFDDLTATCTFLEEADVAGDGQHTLYAAAIDGHGNQSVVTARAIKIDQTAPIVTCPSTSPVFEVGAVGGSITGSVGDPTSGPASGTASAGANTSSAGAKTASLSGSDLAGNVGSAACPYLVKYRFLGFSSPGSMPYTAGSTVQVKFKLGSASGVAISDAQGSALASACSVKVGLTGVSGTNGCATYDKSHDEFGFGLRLPRTLVGGTYRIAVEVFAVTTRVNLEGMDMTVRGVGRG
jgi:CSLREA domain-containing protein